jgi:hypothetical protein
MLLRVATTMGDSLSHPPVWEPEFEGQRPPFQPGNQVSVGNRGPVTHGAWSPRYIEPLAQDLVDLMVADPDTAYLATPKWRPALLAWARAEAAVQLLNEYLSNCGEDGIGDLDEASVRTAHLLLHRAETRATTGRTRLGLDPLSAARLGRDRAAGAFDAARTMQEIERRDQERQRVADESDMDVIDVDVEESP